MKEKKENKGFLRLRERGYRAQSRYRVEVLNENTLARVWSIRFQGWRVLVAAIGGLAALGSLIFVILCYTPLRNWLPGALKGDLRSQYTEAAIKIDSLERITREHSAFARNIIAILKDSIADVDMSRSEALATMTADSLLQTSEAEREFVRSFEEEERFNLSVLSPIAAEGMIFESPTATDEGTGVVTAVYRGTVVSAASDVDGNTTIVVQHPNDFVSVYAGMSASYVARGNKVIAGQRIGTSGAKPIVFELWHSGSLLDTKNYITYKSE